MQAGARAVSLFNQSLDFQQQAKDEIEAARLRALRAEESLEHERQLRATAEGRAKDLEGELTSLQSELAREREMLPELKKVEWQRGHDETFDRLTANYKEQVHEVEMELTDAWSTRFKEGAEWCHKMILEVGAVPSDSPVAIMPEIPSELLEMPTDLSSEEGSEQAEHAEQTGPAEVGGDAPGGQ